MHTKYSTIEAIREASDADLHRWLEWNDGDGDWEGYEDQTELLRATGAYLNALYNSIEDALEGEGLEA